MTDLPNKPWFRIGEAATLLGVFLLIAGCTDENTVWHTKCYQHGQLIEERDEVHGSVYVQGNDVACLRYQVTK